MKSKLRRLVAVMVMIVLMMTLVPVQTLAEVDKDTIVIKFPSISVMYTKIAGQEIMNFNWAAQLAFKNYVESNSGGKMVVELYANAQLGNGPEILQQCMQGVVQATTTGEADLSSFYPELQVFSIPYSFKNRMEFYNVLDGQYVQAMNDDIAKKTGIRIISAFDNGGFRNFSNNKKVVKAATDLKGLKLRCMEIPAHLEMVKAFGGLPTPIPFSELYSALQSGVVDGQENSAMVMMDGSIYEVQKYYTLEGHLISPAYIAVNEGWLKGLTPEQQKVILDAGKIAEYAARGAINASESLALEKMRESGVEVYAPTDEEKATYEVAIAPVVKWLKEQISPTFVDGFIAEVENVRDGKQSVAAAVSDKQVAGSAPVNNNTASQVDNTSKGNTSYLTIIIVMGVVIVLLIAFMFSSKKKKSAGPGAN